MDVQHTLLSHKLLFNRSTMADVNHIVEVHLQKLYDVSSELVQCGIDCNTNALQGAKSSKISLWRQKGNIDIVNYGCKHTS